MLNPIVPSKCRKLLGICLLVLVAFGELSEAVIYETDDRREPYAEPRAWLQEAARSVVAVVRNTALLPRESTSEASFRLRSIPLHKPYHLCEGERYYSQPFAAFCSGFLIAPDKILTAGHCFKDWNCDEVRFVFDYQILPHQESSPMESTLIKKRQVRGCKKIVRSELNVDDDKLDYAIVELDQPVTDRVPLPLSEAALNETALIEAGDELVVIAHTAGLPKKIIPGGKLIQHQTYRSFISTDTSKFSSGSPVINARTKSVVGILVGGEADWTTVGDPATDKNWCRRANICTQDTCQGERMTRIDQIQNVLTTTSEP